MNKIIAVANWFEELKRRAPSTWSHFMTLKTGSSLGTHEIIAAIGAGGMGEVYRVRDPRVGRDVTVKVSSEQFTDRFSREIHAVASLNHSNVATLYDVGSDCLAVQVCVKTLVCRHNPVGQQIQSVRPNAGSRVVAVIFSAM